MQSTIAAAFFVIGSMVAAPAWAWDFPGHRIVGAVAGGFRRAAVAPGVFHGRAFRAFAFGGRPFRRRAFFPVAAGVGFGSGWDWGYPYSYSYGDPCVVWTGYGWINICY